MFVQNIGHEFTYTSCSLGTILSYFLAQYEGSTAIGIYCKTERASTRSNISILALYLMEQSKQMEMTADVLLPQSFYVCCAFSSGQLNSLFCTLQNQYIKLSHCAKAMSFGISQLRFISAMSPFKMGVSCYSLYKFFTRAVDSLNGRFYFVTR
jgi:hypothetical protein